MSVRVTIDAAGLQASLRDPAGLGGRILSKRVERVARRARELAPGTMADMITTPPMDVTARGLGQYVVSNHPASVYVIYGTRPHLIRPRRKGGVLRFEVGGEVVFSRLVHHPGNAANDWLGEALREAI